MAVHYNFADLFELAVDKVPNRTAIIDDRRRTTYAELEDRANRLAHALLAAGVKAGDHVGIYAQNCIEWVEAKFAVYKIRASVVNVNFCWTEAELRYIFDNSDMTAVVYQSEYEPLVARARDAQPGLRGFFRIDDGTPASGLLAEAQDFEAALAAHSGARDFAERSGDDIYLLYTGGTTGMPKGVMWRVEDVFFALGGGIDALTNEKVTTPTALADRIDPGVEQGLVSLQTAPLMHGAGQFGTMRFLFEGNTVVLISKFDAADVWRKITQYKVNVVGFTGDAMARPLADAYEQMKDEIDLSSLVSFGSTAAIFSPSLKTYFREILPEYTMMMDAIGSTEGGMNGFRLVQAGEDPNAKEGITTVNPGRDTVVLDDDLEPIAPGSGQIGKLARGGNIPLGYYKDPAKTAETFLTDKHGNRWSIPGDFARLEDDGRITLLGRGNVSINSGGEKIFPEEVEGALKGHPAIFDCLVVGLPDDRWGQRVAAVVQLRDGHDAPSVDEVREFAKDALAGYKLPRELIFVSEVPRHANGKADYRRAQTMAAELTQPNA